jgi:hypothetical protein
MVLDDRDFTLHKIICHCSYQIKVTTSQATLLGAVRVWPNLIR